MTPMAEPSADNTTLTDNTRSAGRPSGRRTGRPRANAVATISEDPVEEILAASSRLFGELGVGATTRSRIAASVGLGQSSLYYYFSRKEDLVAALVDRANLAPLGLIETIVANGGTPAEQLHAFVRGDVVALCRLPFDINEIHRMAGREPDRFAEYWVERTELAAQLAKVLRRGVRDGSFRSVNVRRTALTVMANDEGTQNWFRVNVPGQPAASPEAIATDLADLTVAGLLAPGLCLTDVLGAG